jgi:glycosyltransferase involved in cell wall biosynthesis
MHVAIYSDCDSRAGVLTYTLTLSAALCNVGVRVTIVTHEPQNASAASIVEEMRVSADRVELLPPETHTVLDSKRLADVVLASGADLYIPNYREMPHAAGALCSQRGSVKVIGVCHNDHWSSYKLLERFERCLSRFVCACEKTESVLRGRLPKRDADIACIPHGVRISEQACEPFTGGVLRLVYHGRLVEEQKRLSTLLAIAHRLCSSQVPFELAIIGDGPARDECILAAEDPSLRRHVKVIGGLDWEGISGYLANSHVTVLTSEYEGFCLSVAEGMGAGLPAVAFRCGDVIEQFVAHGQTGLVATPGSIDEFVDAIRNLQGNPGLWRELSRNGRRLINEKFSWSAAAMNYVKLFECAVAEPTRRKWPRGRPAWIPPEGRSLRSAVERIGKVAGLWDS